MALKGFFFSFMEMIVTEVIRSKFLNETHHQNFYHWSQSVTFTQALVEKTIIDQSFNALVAAFEKQHVIKTVEEELKTDSIVTNIIVVLLGGQ